MNVCVYGIFALAGFATYEFLPYICKVSQMQKRSRIRNTVNRKAAILVTLYNIGKL